MYVGSIGNVDRRFDKHQNGKNKITKPCLKCPDGEIGRRTAFRWQRSQGCAGSNPVLGTKVDKSKIDSVCPLSFLLKPLPRLYISSTASLSLAVR